MYALAHLYGALDVAGENILSGMISSDVLIKISTLFGFVRTVWTLELRLFAALVPRVSQ